MQRTIPFRRVWQPTLIGLAVAVLLTACASTPPETAPPPPVAPQPGPPVPPPPTAPATPAAQQQAQKEAQSAVEALEDGREEDARAILRKALTLDPNNKLALSLARQLTADPVLMLGRESFSYTVKPGESLSRIAGHFMGDIYLFYALARYNDIKVPRQVAGGQVIRVPGKAPPPEEREVTRPAPKPPRGAPGKPGVAEPPPAPPPAPVAPPPPPPPPAPPPAPEPTQGERAMQSAASAERGGNLERAMAEYRRAASLDQAGAAGKAEAVRKQLVSRYTVQARGAFARQDLDGAIGNWNKLLEIDPGNDLAKLEKQKALALKEKIKALK
jgi:LysM repeat protein